MARKASRRIASAAEHTHDAHPTVAGGPASEVREVAAELLRSPRLFTSVRDAASAAAAPARPSAHTSRWRQLFSAAGPREILARIVPDDPLGVRAIVARRLATQALLVDADRVHVRSLALCARWAPRYDGEPELDVWLDSIVDQALSELTGDIDELAERDGDGALDAFETLGRPLQLDPSALRAACRAFNRLALADRRAFFELVLRRRTLDAVARECERSATEVARQARRALEVFCGVAEFPARKLPARDLTEKEP